MAQREAYVAPSILAADFGKLKEECESVLASGADWLHIDIMDGHFVPNLSLGVPVLKSLYGCIPKAYYDVHLMVQDPGKWVKPFAAAGASQLTFHWEAVKSIEEAREVVKQIKDCGCDVGVSVKPKTPVEAVFPLIAEGQIQTLLVMTVDPGFGGQSFMTDMLSKVKLARDKFDTLIIQVDGGVTKDNVASVAQQGGNAFVAGTAIFKASDRKNYIAQMRQEASGIRCQS